jgi:fucose permease
VQHVQWTTLSANNHLTLALGFVSFLLLGVYRSLFGPAFALFVDHYGMGTEPFGMLVAMNGIGALLAIIFGGMVLPRLGYKQLLVIAFVSWSLGALGFAIQPVYGWLLAAALLAGWGGGALDIAINALFSHVFTSATPLNLIHVAYGVGAITGPLLVTVSFGIGLALPYGIVGMAVAFLLLLLVRLEPPPVLQPEATTSRAHAASLLWAVSAFIVLYFCYVGIEVGVGNWLSVHLTPTFGAARAASFTSIYWAMLTLGRFLAAPVSKWLEPPQLLLVSSSIMIVGFGLCFNPHIAPFGYALVGLGSAPVFPTGLLWLRSCFPTRAAAMMATVMVSATIGGIFLSWLFGVLVARLSVTVIPTLLLGSAVGCLASVLWLRWHGKHT